MVGAFPASVAKVGEQVVGFDEIQTITVDRALVDISDFDTTIAIPDDNRITDINEQPVFNHARHLVHHQGKLTRVADPVQVQVQTYQHEARGGCEKRGTWPLDCLWMGGIKGGQQGDNPEEVRVQELR